MRSQKQKTFEIAPVQTQKTVVFNWRGSNPKFSLNRKYYGISVVAIVDQRPCIFLPNDCFSKKQKVERQKTSLREKLNKAKWNGYEKHKSEGTCELLIDWLIDWKIIAPHNQAFFLNVAPSQPDYNSIWKSHPVQPKHLIWGVQLHLCTPPRPASACL